MKNKLFLALVTTQIVVIIFLAIHIYKNKENTLGVISVNPISKQSLISTPAASLKFFTEPKPNTVIKNKPDFLPFESINTINSDSLNERYEYAIEKSPETYRIISLGDSFTYGLYVDTKDNYSKVLEDMLNSRLSCKNIKKFEVINLGVIGYDIAYSVERFKKRGQKYNPDLIIWLLKSDDFFLIEDEFRGMMLPYEQDKESGKLKPADYAKIFDQMLQRFKNESNINRKYQYQSSALNLLLKFYSKKLVIITIPAIIEEKQIKILKDFANSNKNVLFDSSIIRNDITAISNIIRKDDYHPNKRGHFLIAEDLFKFLAAKNLFVCN